MPTPRARATTRQRQAEHTVVRAVSVTAATTAGQVTARSPSSNGAAPTSRTRNHSTVTPAARRSNDGPKRRTAGTERSNATPVTRADWTHGSIVRRGSMASPRPVAVNPGDRGPVVLMRDGGGWLGRRRRGAYCSACRRRRAAYEPARGQRRATYDPARDDPGAARHGRPARRRV